jgi:hypothetical protein
MRNKNPKRRMRPARKFIVRMINGCALQFYPDGRGYGIIPDAQATTFRDQHEAQLRAREAKVPWNQFVVEEVLDAPAAEEAKR